MASVDGVATKDPEPSPPRDPPMEDPIHPAPSPPGLFPTVPGLSGWSEGIARPGSTLRPGDPPPPSEEATATAQRLGGRIHKELRESFNAHRLATGVMDPYFTKLAEALRDASKDPPRAEDTAAVVKDLLGAMSSAGAAYATTGNPYAEGEGPEGIAARENIDPLARVAREAPGGFSAKLFRQLEAAARLREFADGRFGAGLVTQVELRQQKDGVVLDAKLVKSSGSAAFDRHILAKAPEAAMKLGPLPQAGPGILESGARTLWSFEAHLVFKKEPMKPGGDALGFADLVQAVVVGTLTGTGGGMVTGTLDDDGSPSVASLAAPSYRVRVRLLRIYDD